MEYIYGAILASFLVAAVAVALNGLTVIQQYERGIILTLGRYSGVMEPGFRYLIPYLQTLHKTDLRVQVIDIPSQDVITSDNVSVKVSAVCFYKIVDAKLALLEVQHIGGAIQKLAPIALRSNIGKHTMDALLSQQQVLNAELATALEERTTSWGVHIQNVEIRSVDLEHSMVRAMAQEAEATRGARARIITAQGEFEAAGKLAEAAEILARNPTALVLRSLATLKEIGANQNTTIIFPVAQETLMGPSPASLALALAAQQPGAHTHSKPDEGMAS